MIESCFDNHLNVQHATDYMGTYLMYLWAINVIVIIDFRKENIYIYIYIHKPKTNMETCKRIMLDTHRCSAGLNRGLARNNATYSYIHKIAEQCQVRRETQKPADLEALQKQIRKPQPQVPSLHFHGPHKHAKRHPNMAGVGS